MPLNILQQKKLQIYTQTGSSRGQWSHWFVGLFSVRTPPHPPSPPHNQKPASWCTASKQIVQLSCLFFTILIWFEVLKVGNFTATWPEREIKIMRKKKKKKEDVNRKMFFYAWRLIFFFFFMYAGRSKGRWIRNKKENKWGGLSVILANKSSGVCRFLNHLWRNNVQRK